VLRKFPLCWIFSQKSNSGTVLIIMTRCARRSTYRKLSQNSHRAGHLEGYFLRRCPGAVRQALGSPAAIDMNKPVRASERSGADHA
jgi:hypothetical protein